MSVSEVTQLGVLVVTQGHWGERIAANIVRRHPPHWVVQCWSAPRVLPPTIDDPLDFLPDTLPGADLILALGDIPATGQLIPEIVKLSGARAVIAPVDRAESLPPGLQRQIREWLDELKVAVVFPMPFCSLTPTTCNHPPLVVKYSNPLIGEFALYFGRPDLRMTIDTSNSIGHVSVRRDAPCGCTNYVAENLANIPVDQAEYQAGMLHHHYPCLAGMSSAPAYHDTLMHVSGHILRETVKAQIREYLAPEPYFTPLGKVEE